MTLEVLCVISNEKPMYTKPRKEKAIQNDWVREMERIRIGFAYERHTNF